jgi:hypothetical protein
MPMRGDPQPLDNPDWLITPDAPATATATATATAEAA